MAVDTDIAIIGGGPVGAALALALGGSGGGDLRISLLEARVEHTSDPRPIALSHGSRLLLERLGVWNGLSARAAPTPIQHIHVSQRGAFGRVAMNAGDAGVPALGYVVDYGAVATVLADAVQATPCAYHAGARATAIHRAGESNRVDYTLNDAPDALSARLVVVADGGDIDGFAPPKVVDYAQTALTARVHTTRPHRNTAYERFTPEGPLALLPFGAAMALVWTLPFGRAQALQAADSPAFLTALREAFGARLGEFSAVERRAAYALMLRTAARPARPSVVAIGNAAQTLHPVAGQGFNLGLRDAWELASLLRAAPPQMIAAADTLQRFAASRRIDRAATRYTTHGLVRVFSNDLLPLTALRGVGMSLLGSVAPARDFLARRMIFGARG